jgi:hypothetical protein
MEQLNTTSDASPIEHLKNQELQILTCLDTVENSQVPESIDLNQIDIIDLYGTQDEAKEQGSLRSENIAYVISGINDHDKISSKYKSCTGIVISGIDKHTQKPISILTHQNPGYIFYGDEDSFTNSLREKISRFKSRCDEKTIDAVVFGGQLLKFKNLPDTNPAQKMITEEYGNSIKLVSDLIKDELGFIPTVVDGPKTSTGFDIALYQNNTRRLFLYRDENAGKFTKAFNASFIDDNYPNWSPSEVTIEEYLGKKKN